MEEGMRELMEKMNGDQKDQCERQERKKGDIVAENLLNLRKASLHIAKKLNKLQVRKMQRSQDIKEKH